MKRVLDILEFAFKCLVVLAAFSLIGQSLHEAFPRSRYYVAAYNSGGEYLGWIEITKSEYEAMQEIPLATTLAERR